MSTILVPFTSREWQIVQGLFLKHGDELIPAAEILTMWQCRQGSINPVIFQITDQLLHIDRLWYRTDFNDDYAVKTLLNNYSTVIVRVINYVNEICQSQPGTTTIASAVANMDVPGWIVDLRHRAAHNHMPPLEMFKNATDYLRNWVWEKYWSKPIDEAIKWGIPKKAFEEQLVQNRIEIQKSPAFEIIKKYVQWRNEEPMALPTPQELAKIPVIIELSEFITKYPDVFVSILAEDVLILSTKRIEKGGFSIDCNENGIWLIPGELQTYWSPLITLLHQKNLIMKLVLTCLKVMHEPSSVYDERKQLAGWVDLFLDMLLLILKKKNTSDHNQDDFFQWHQIVKCIVNKIDDFCSERVIDILQSTKIFTEKRTNQLINIMKLRARDRKISKAESTTDSTSKRLEVADRNFKHLGSKMITDLPKVADVNENMEWCLADTDFTDCPLGLMPNQSSESLYLLID